MRSEKENMLVLLSIDEREPILRAVRIEKKDV